MEPHLFHSRCSVCSKRECCEVKAIRPLSFGLSLQVCFRSDTWIENGILVSLYGKRKDHPPPPWKKNRVKPSLFGISLNNFFALIDCIILNSQGFQLFICFVTGLYVFFLSLPLYCYTGITKTFSRYMYMVGFSNSLTLSDNRYLSQ